MKKNISFLKQILLEKYDKEFVDNLSEDDIIELVQKVTLKKNKKKKNYYRSLDVVETNSITVQAYGYLISLLEIDAITSVTFEKIIQLCLHIYFSTEVRINRSKIDKIVTMINFADVSQTSVKEMIEPLIADNGSNIKSIFKYRN